MIETITVGQLVTDAGEDSRAALPLVLDLDGSLVRTDLLLESALAYVRSNPLRAFQVCAWIRHGRAVLKQNLARRGALEMDMLPLNDELVDYARAEKAKGRRIYIATAADIFLAKRIADRLGFIDGVIGSDGITNLRGRAKAERLAHMFPGGFAYAGDAAVDLAVWRKASAAILVEVEPRIERAARRLGQPEAVFPRRSAISAFLKAARPHQWAKNLLVFVPLILGGQAMSATAWASACLAFLALGLLASTTYLVNDLWDLPDDRRHWSKRNRPLASGRLKLRTAFLAIPTGLAWSLLLASLVGAGAVAVLAFYLALTLAYSVRLKRAPILDVFVLAALFTARLGLGIVAAGVAASPWLLVFSMFLFASLSFAKRHTEVARSAARGEAKISGRGYVAQDAPLLLAMGTASGLGAVLVMVLYLTLDAFNASFYADPIWLWAFPSILFLWIGRVWLLCQRGELHDDPVAFAVRDRTSIALGGVMTAAFLAAWVGILL